MTWRLHFPQMKIRRYSYLSHSSPYCAGIMASHSTSGDVQIGKVAFQTYNDLVVCAPFHVITQISNLDFKVREYSGMFLASNGSTVVLVPLLHVIYGITTLPGFTLSALTIKCIFPDLTRIPHLNTHPTENSCMLVCQRLLCPSLGCTNRLSPCKFPTSQMNITLSPALTEHSPATDLFLFGVNPQTEYVSILAICMPKL